MLPGDAQATSWTTVYGDGSLNAVVVYTQVVRPTVTWSNALALTSSSCLAAR